MTLEIWSLFALIMFFSLIFLCLHVWKNNSDIIIKSHHTLYLINNSIALQSIAPPSIRVHFYWCIEEGLHVWLLLQSILISIIPQVGYLD